MIDVLVEQSLCVRCVRALCACVCVCVWWKVMCVGVWCGYGGSGCGWERRKRRGVWRVCREVGDGRDGGRCVEGVNDYVVYVSLCVL